MWLIFDFKEGTGRAGLTGRGRYMQRKGDWVCVTLTKHCLALDPNSLGSVIFNYWATGRTKISVIFRAGCFSQII